MPKYNYSDSTAKKIANYIYKHPGHTGREIAKALNLNKENINSWLYTHSIQQKYKVKVDKRRWYPQQVKVFNTYNNYTPQTFQQKTPKPFIKPKLKKEKTVAELKETIHKYTTKQIQNIYDNPGYDSMSDVFKLALWEVLQEREESEKVPNPQLTVDHWKEEIKKYDPETVEKAFLNSKYNNLIDDQKAALAEVLEEQKNNQVKTTNCNNTHLARHELLRVTSFIALLLLAFLFLNNRLLTIIYTPSPSPNQDNITKPLIK